MQKTNIKRSWGTTVGYLIGALVAIAISGLLFMTIASGPITVGFALLPGILGVILIIMAFGASGVGTCPVCGAELSGLSTKANDGVSCPSCRNYVEGRAGMLWRTDENRIADSPIFASPLPERFTFPEGCCICGMPASTHETISLSSQSASSAVTAQVGVTSSTRLDIEVPHCAEHSGGASLSGTPESPFIRFRSYACLRTFCQLNGTQPGYQTGPPQPVAEKAHA